MQNLYIDPGTGSMLFSILVGGVTAALFGVRALFVRLKYFGFGKSKEKSSSATIPCVVFSDNKRYRTVFEGILREADKRGMDITYYTLSKDDPLLELNLPHIHGEYLGEGGKAFAKLNSLKANIVLSTTPHLDVYQWKRSKNVKLYVHIPHMVSDIATYKMFSLDFYDSVLTTGQNQIDDIKELETIRPNVKRKELVIVGSPQFDVLEKKYNEKGRKTLNKQKVVLLAPSWGKSAILSRFGEKILCALKKTDYHVIVRPHPQSVQSESEMLKTLESKFNTFEWNYDLDGFDCMNRSDIMITDFSGIIYEYTLVFGKPIIYADTSFDVSPYEAYWMKEKPWGLRMVEKLGMPLKEEQFDNITSVIEKALTSTSLKENREEIKNICYQNRGEADKRVVDYLQKKEAEIKEREEKIMEEAEKKIKNRKKDKVA